MAELLADQMIDMQVAASVQSLKETRDCLQRLHDEITQKGIDYHEQAHGFRRNAMFKGKSAAFIEFAQELQREIDKYNNRIELNQRNNGIMHDKKGL